MPIREDLADFTIVLATQEQQVEHAKIAFLSWHRGRTFKDQTQEREDGDWAKDQGLLCWVLVRKDDQNGEIYAGCETYRRKTLIRKAGSTEVSNAYGYGIASVITPAKHQRNGYATHFLRLLHYVLGDPKDLPTFPETWGSPPPALPPISQRDPSLEQALSVLEAPRPDYLPYGIASILWSDVGYTFYSKCSIGSELPGWVVIEKENSEIIWKLQPPSEKVNAMQDWDILYRKDLPTIANIMMGDISREIGGSVKTDVDIWAFDPHGPGAVEMVLLMELVSDPSLGLDANSTPIGIRNGEQVVLFALRQHGVGKRLNITYFSKSIQAYQVSSILDILDIVGKDTGYTEGWVWGLDLSATVAQAWKNEEGRHTQMGKRAEVDGHLLGVAWYGSHMKPRAEMVDVQMWTWC